MRNAQKPIVVAVLVGALVAPAGAAVLCRQTSGAVVVRGACKRREVRLNVADLVGPKGDAGSQGPPGANAAANVIIKRRDMAVPANGTFGNVVFCPAGYHATGGGAELDSGASSLFGSAPRNTTRGAGTPPTDGDVSEGWHTAIKNTGASSTTGHWYAVCVSP